MRSSSRLGRTPVLDRTFVIIAYHGWVQEDGFIATWPRLRRATSALLVAAAATRSPATRPCARADRAGTRRAHRRRMSKIAFVLSAILFAAGCGGNGSTGSDMSGLACVHPSECGNGNQCCVSYSANFGGRSQSSCMPRGACPVSQVIDGGDAIACDSDGDCAGISSADGGTRTLSCCPVIDTGFSGKLCVAASHC
jgi:hypothetical protein